MLPEIRFDEYLFHQPDQREKPDWLICQHFTNPMAIASHYRNFKPIVIFNNTILCEKCYQQLIRGRYHEVYKSCRKMDDNAYKKVMADSLIEANKEMQVDLLIRP
jgi:hypothetical protein